MRRREPDSGDMRALYERIRQGLRFAEPDLSEEELHQRAELQARLWTAAVGPEEGHRRAGASQKEVSSARGNH
jgi:hypothetical protein